MKFGLHGINTGVCSEPEAALQVARAAEAAGFDSVWTAEHVVLPDPQAPPSPAPPQTKLLDPAVALAFIAAQTRELRLATGIIILPQRNPVVLAKELASVDRLSHGRLVFGLGAGYLKPEFQALGVPFADRGRRTDEYIEAILALWTQDKPEYKGEYVAFGGIQAQPRPVQSPHPPRWTSTPRAARSRGCAPPSSGSTASPRWAAWRSPSHLPRARSSTSTPCSAMRRWVWIASCC